MQLQATFKSKILLDVLLNIPVNVVSALPSVHRYSCKMYIHLLCLQSINIPINAAFAMPSVLYLLMPSVHKFSITLTFTDLSEIDEVGEVGCWVSGSRHLEVQLDLGHHLCIPWI